MSGISSATSPNSNTLFHPPSKEEGNYLDLTLSTLSPALSALSTLSEIVRNEIELLQKPDDRVRLDFGKYSPLIESRVMSYQGAFKGVPEFLNAEITDLKMDRLVAKIENSKFGQEHKDEIITTYKQTLSNLKDLWSFLSKNKNEKYIQEIFIVDKPDDLHELRKMSSSLLNLNDHADSQELLAYFNKLNKQISNTSKAIIESLPKELKENFQKLNVKNNNSLPILNDKFNSNKSFEEEDFDETRETVQLLVEENKNLLAALKSANSKCS